MGQDKRRIYWYDIRREPLYMQAINCVLCHASFNDHNWIDLDIEEFIINCSVMVANRAKNML